VQLHFALLNDVADEDGPGGKARFAGGVLGMKISGGEEKFPVAGRQFGGDLCDGGAVCRSQTGIDNEDRAASYNDGDVGPAHDGPHMVRDLDCVFSEDGLILG
jgi:hypothetical protein